jgi:hypothetical protein
MLIQSNAGPDKRNAEEAKPENIKYTAPVSGDIRKDVSALQSDVANLAADIKKAGSDKAREAVSYVNEHIGSLKNSGTNTIENIENKIKSKPGQSIAIAFVAGVVTSYIFGRKS